MGEMETARGMLVVLQVLSEGPASRRCLGQALREVGIDRDERTVRRWLEVLREEGFVESNGRLHVLRGSPVRLDFDGYEALSALSVLQSLGDREPVYGKYLASAAAKLRDALPREALKFADLGGIEFDLESASHPTEDPEIIDVLRRAAHQHRRTEVLYYSLRSDTVRWRTVEPVRVAYAQRAHRLYAYEREENRVTEFRINRIREARILPDKFAPEAHVRSFEPARIRLGEKAFTAYGRSIIPDPDATIQRLDDGGAIIDGRTPSTFWTVRDVAALGPDAEVLGSPKLKQELRAFLRETLKKYE
ncbi:MAG: WYL domain-containing protein [Rubrobacteraceae bacterium]